MATEVYPPTIKSSPWGSVQHQTNYTQGVDAVSTAGHGGFKLDRRWNGFIPEAFRRADGWYEEDCDAYIVVYFLPLPEFADKKVAAEKSLKSWNWQEWEAWTGRPLAPGESSMKDRDVANRQTA